MTKAPRDMERMYSTRRSLRSYADLRTLSNATSRSGSRSPASGSGCRRHPVLDRARTRSTTRRRSSSSSSGRSSPPGDRFGRRPRRVVLGRAGSSHPVLGSDQLTVLVMGATGDVGGAVVAALRSGVARLRAVSRRERPWPDGVEGFVGDPNVEHGLDGAVRWRRRRLHDGRVRRRGGAARSPRQCSTSYCCRPARPTSGAGAMRWQRSTSAQSSRVGIRVSWTFLRPCSLQSILLRWRTGCTQGDVVRAPFDDVSPAMVDPADVGAVRRSP